LAEYLIYLALYEKKADSEFDCIDYPPFADRYIDDDVAYNDDKGFGNKLLHIRKRNC